MKYLRNNDSLPSSSEKEKAVRKMFDRIAPRYDLLNRLITFGLDTRWRKKTVQFIKTPPSGTVLDVACGTGDQVAQRLAYFCAANDRFGRGGRTTNYKACLLPVALVSYRPLVD